jgi:hypothetical protein
VIVVIATSSTLYQFYIGRFAQNLNHRFHQIIDPVEDEVTFHFCITQIVGFVFRLQYWRVNDMRLEEAAVPPVMVLIRAETIAVQQRLRPSV